MAYLLETCLLFLLLCLVLPSGKSEGGLRKERSISNPGVETIQIDPKSYMVQGNASSNKTWSASKESLSKKIASGKSIEAIIWDPLLSNAQTQDKGSDIVNHWAVARVDKGEFYGATATFDVYGLSKVGPDQTSSTVVWLTDDLSGPLNSHNLIVAGWQVAPQLYGDYDTHLVVYWTADGGRSTGCYNLNCQGFVLYPSTKYVPGAKISPVSVINGIQHEISLVISKASQNGDWWLYAGHNLHTPIGHWPKSLFTSLAEKASIVQWGGVVSFHKGDKSPALGSGQWPRAGFGKAAYFKDTYSILEYGVLQHQFLHLVSDKSQCYQIEGREPYYYGGPGDCTD